MADFIPGLTGWTAATLMPDKGLHDAAHNAIGNTFPDLPDMPSSSPATSAVPFTPSSFATGSAPGLVDPTLASRPYTSAPAGSMSSVFQTSPYNTPNVPGFLQQAVNNLNSNQSAQWSAQNDIINKIFGNIKTGASDESQWLDVLRSAVIRPGSAGYFGQAIQNPTLQAQQGNLFNAQAANTQAQTDAMQAEAKRKADWNALMTAPRGGTGWTSFSGGWTPPTF